MEVVVCIPTLNPGGRAEELLGSLRAQVDISFRVLIIDSDSDDGSMDIFRAAGADVHTIRRDEFNHGRTRQLGVEMAQEAYIITFMTQDAVLATPESLKNLLLSFQDGSVAAAYGRQLPARDASPIAAHARIYNYPDRSMTKSIEDASKMGIKTVFISNTFAAYRRSALLSAGGVPGEVILSEDMYVAAKLLLSGFKVAYRADACVYHSHNYSILQEFRRYFDQGVFHARESWMRELFGQNEEEGKRFIISELSYLMKRSPLLIPSAMQRNLFKLAGYKLGLKEEFLSVSLKRRLSMNKGFWK
jgi:rhamnosyltransferase